MPAPGAGPGAALELRVHVPALARFPAHLRDLCALLPVADINGALFEALHSGYVIAPPDAAGLFLTDPFLNVDDAARRLMAAGVSAVANYPTVQGFDGPSADALAQVGHSFDQECALLAAFAARGFSLVGYAASASAALALVGLGARAIVRIGTWAPEPDALSGPHMGLAPHQHAATGPAREGPAREGPAASDLPA
jgi:predicted TIM-barrel enzyme